VTDKYQEAVQTLYEAYKGVIGRAADGIAKRNENTEFEDGEITGFEGEEEELAEFIDDYKDVMGEVANTLAKQNLDDINPENLR